MLAYKAPTNHAMTEATSKVKKTTLQGRDRHRSMSLTREQPRQSRGRRKRTRPPPKEYLLDNLSGLKKFQASGGYKKPVKTRINHIHHRNLSSVGPIFFGKKKFLSGEGALCAFFFPGFWEGSATKQKAVKRSAFSLNEGKAFSE